MFGCCCWSTNCPCEGCVNGRGVVDWMLVGGMLKVFGGREGSFEKKFWILSFCFQGCGMFVCPLSIGFGIGFCLFVVAFIALCCCKACMASAGDFFPYLRASRYDLWLDIGSWASWFLTGAGIGVSKRRGFNIWIVLAEGLPSDILGL